MTGDWDDALADADAVLAGPSAPLARTWPHLVRGLVALRRGGDADADLDEAWELAQRFGEPIRLLPAAAALVERVVAARRADDRLDAAAAPLLDDARVGPGVGARRAGGLAAPARPASSTGSATSTGSPSRTGSARRPHREAAAVWAALSCPYEQALALVDAGDAGRRAQPGSTCSTVSAPTRWRPRCARTCAPRGRDGPGPPPAPRRGTTRPGSPAARSRSCACSPTASPTPSSPQRLYISPKTVDHHVSAILAKLQVASRRDAVRRGRAAGILQ